jgi:hypothetical protein
VLVGSADIGRDHLQDHALLDFAALRVLELGVRDILNLDFSRLGVDDAAISTHDKPLLQGGRTDCVSMRWRSGRGKGKLAEPREKCIDARRNIADGISPAIEKQLTASDGECAPPLLISLEFGGSIEIATIEIATW